MKSSVFLQNPYETLKIKSEQENLKNMFYEEQRDWIDSSQIDAPVLWRLNMINWIQRNHGTMIW